MTFLTFSKEMIGDASLSLILLYIPFSPELSLPIWNDNIVYICLILLSQLSLKFSYSHNQISSYLKYFKCYRAINSDYSTIRRGRDCIFHTMGTWSWMNLSLIGWSSCMRLINCSLDLGLVLWMVIFSRFLVLFIILLIHKIYRVWRSSWLWSWRKY